MMKKWMIDKNYVNSFFNSSFFGMQKKTILAHTRTQSPLGGGREETKRIFGRTEGRANPLRLLSAAA